MEYVSNDEGNKFISLVCCYDLFVPLLCLLILLSAEHLFSWFFGGFVAGGGEGGSSSQSLHSIFLLCRPCNCKIFKFESEKIFSQLKKMLLNRKSRPH